VPPIASPLPPLATRPPELPSELEVSGEATRPFSDHPRTLAPLTEAGFQVHEAVAPPEATAAVAAATVQEDVIQPQITAPSRGIDVTAFLRSATGRRDAIIVREILGPPRGVRMQTEFSEAIS